MLSELNSLPSLVSSELHYERAFKLFLATVDNSLNHKLWLVQSVPELLHSNTDRVSVLSVGCGDGNTDVDVLLPLLKKYGQVTYHGIEPNSIHRELFLTRLTTGLRDSDCSVKTLEGNITQFKTSHIEVLLYDCKFEDFTPPSGSPQYDMVLCGHSLYYITPLGQSIHRLLFSLLSPTGHLIIIHSTPGGIPQFQRCSGVISGSHNITTFTILDELYTLLDIRVPFRTEWIPQLTTNKSSEVKVHIADTYLNVDCIFDENQDETARLLLGFFIDKNLSDATKKQMEELRHLMKSMSSQNKGGEWLFWQPEGRIIVKAPSAGSSNGREANSATN
ncbi:hypothetical protein K7432_007961 [Basidiobolus ranarum]|uniref:Methyltransferase domain-containing protein n=1 Tax=Basidiobolus ranarum TaxID=34480 RepID=A0ABR2WSI3_9FUNG